MKIETPSGVFSKFGYSFLFAGMMGVLPVMTAAVGVPFSMGEAFLDSHRA